MKSKVPSHSFETEHKPGVLTFDFMSPRLAGHSDRSYTWSAHIHQGEYEVIITDTGTHRCAVNGTWMQLEPTQGVLLQPGDEHEVNSGDPEHHFVLRFRIHSPGLNPKQAQVFRDDINPLQQCFSLDTAIHRQLLNEYWQVREEPGDFIGPLLEGLLTVFCWRVFSAFDPSILNPAFRELSLTNTFPNQLRRVLAPYVYTQISVADIAAEMHMSVNTLRRRCAKLLGSSPYQIFLAMKMEHARGYLEDRGWQIKEIAHHFGFANQYAFSRAFKTHFGESPSHWCKYNRKT